MKNFSISILISFFLLAACKGQHSSNLIQKSGRKIETRFKTPAGFARKTLSSSSFGYYLRNLPLKPAGTKVKLYNGEVKSNYAYDAVVDMEISPRDLQQCADAVMRLRGEYLYSRQRFNEISFALNNGFEMDFKNWMAGNRVSIIGNHAEWVSSASASNSYASFRKYMDFVFAYAGTISLSKTLQTKDLSNVTAGDVFVKGGSPGHAVIVVDIAENNQGERIFLLAQSYMPAQEIQILKNPNDRKSTPWYSSKIIGDVITPEYTFRQNQLKTWR